MITVLRKIKLSDTYPVDYYINRHKLVGINPTLDSSVLPWLQALFDLYQFGGQINTVKREGEWHYNSLNDTVCYVVFFYDSMETYTQISTSQQMKAFTDTCDKLYQIIGWEEQGVKVISNWDDNAQRDATTMETLWNNS
jgi:hypothetical protein